MFEGATNTTITRSIIHDIGRDAAIFKFDGDGPLHADMKALVVRGSLDRVSSFNDRSPSQTGETYFGFICNLPHANAAYNDYASKDKKHVTCFKNTRRTLRKEVAEWITAILARPEICLLSSLAGIAKSTVIQTIAERADDLHLLRASFFFARDESDLRNAKKFYTTFAFQLCVYDKQFSQAIGEVLLEEKGAFAASKEPREQLDALIIKPLRHLLDQRSRPLVIVADAPVDECDEEDGVLVSFPCFDSVIYSM